MAPQGLQQLGNGFRSKIAQVDPAVSSDVTTALSAKRSRSKRGMAGGKRAGGYYNLYRIFPMIFPCKETPVFLTNGIFLQAWPYREKKANLDVLWVAYVAARHPQARVLRHPLVAGASSHSALSVTRYKTAVAIGD